MLSLLTSWFNTSHADGIITRRQEYNLKMERETQRLRLEIDEAMNKRTAEIAKQGQHTDTARVVTFEEDHGPIPELVEDSGSDDSDSDNDSLPDLKDNNFGPPPVLIRAEGYDWREHNLNDWTQDEFYDWTQDNENIK